MRIDRECYMQGAPRLQTGRPDTATVISTQTRPTDAGEKSTYNFDDDFRPGL